MKKSTKMISMLCVLFASFAFSQNTGLDKGIAIGNILVQGFAALHSNQNKTTDSNSKTVEKFCFKNKTDDKITVKFGRKTEDVEINKELIIRKDEKECMFDLLKGVYTYEVILVNNETLQKGEYKVAEDALMTINKN
jgi:hypothetical protein